MKKTENKIFLAGHTGFLGKRMRKRLEADGYNFCAASRSSGLDFRRADEVDKFFEKERPSVILDCAAYVGGIKFNAEHEGEIYYNNILMNANLQDAARRFGVQKYVQPIANCSYPDVADKDFREEEWWDGPLHPSVMVYGFARKAAWVNAYAYHGQYGMNYTTFLVPNMYGPEDHFDEVRSHAMGALIRKIADAKEKKQPEVTVWGTGKPIREWLYVDDCVEAMLLALEKETGINPINIGQGVGISIRDMAEAIQKVVGYEGQLVFDASRPDGAAYKIMNVDRMKEIFSWVPGTTLDEGIRKTVEWYQAHVHLDAQSIPQSAFPG